MAARARGSPAINVPRTKDEWMKSARSDLRRTGRNHLSGVQLPCPINFSTATWGFVPSLMVMLLPG